MINRRKGLFIYSITIIFLTIFVLIITDVTKGNNKIKDLITKDDNNKEIIIKSGDIIQIELETSGATGYTWHIDKLDREYLFVIAEGTKDIAKGMVML